MSKSPRHIGKYELQECLRRSGLAETWKALDTQSQRYVAIKIFHPDLQTASNFIARFQREVQIVSSMRHPNIVQINDFHTFQPPESDNTLAYIVMDYVEGQTLAEYIHSTSHMRQFPSAAVIVHLFASISIAIDYAHQRGLACCNINPANILLAQHHSAANSPGEPLLTDFGIGNSPATSTNNSSDAHLDIALYLAPEQAHGYIGNEHSDIYSLGVILYEICTGTRPFQGDTPGSIMMQHINTMPTSPVLINPNIPPALAGVILRSLAKDPALRFTSASSMASALAEAFNQPIPEKLDLPLHFADNMNEPTYYKPLRTNSLPGVPPLQIVRSSSLPPVTLPAPSHPQSAMLANSMQETSTTPSGGIPTVSLANSPPDLPIKSTPSQVSMPALALPLTPPVSIPPPRRRRNGLIIALIALLLLVLIGSGLGTLFLLPRGNPAPTSSIVGHAFFVSSGTLNKDSSENINDELLIKLHNVPDPAAGKSYYAWLLVDNSQANAAPILLGKLPVLHGQVNYLSNPQNINLLAIASRLVISEEAAKTTPTSPSTNLWQYYAELPQKPDPQDTANHFSMLSHLRNLLSEDPTLQKAKISGGLATWLVRNTGKVLEWTGSARDDWTTGSSTFLRNHLIYVLEYIDGQARVLASLPPAGIPLIGLTSQNQATPGYLHEINDHLVAIARAPGVAADKGKLVDEIKIAIKNVGNWLKQVHDKAEQLVKLTNEQLLLPSSQLILDQMQNLAFYAYAGQFDPLTGKVQAGTVQINNDIEQLASFDVTPYPS